MTNDQIRAVLWAKPFVPFTMRMADGRFFDVRHPEFVRPNPFGRTVVYIDPMTGRSSILDLFLMTEVQFLVPEPELPSMTDDLADAPKEG